MAHGVGNTAEFQEIDIMKHRAFLLNTLYLKKYIRDYNNLQINIYPFEQRKIVPPYLGWTPRTIKLPPIDEIPYKERIE